MLTSKLCSLP